MYARRVEFLRARDLSTSSQCVAAVTFRNSGSDQGPLSKDHVDFKPDESSTSVSLLCLDGSKNNHDQNFNKTFVFS